MYQPVIDAHIHLDLYSKENQAVIIDDLKKYKIDHLISVSQDMVSSQKNLALSQQHNEIKAAFGFHPEQGLPMESELIELQYFIEENQHHMVAVGEVGLPYYLRQEDQTLAMEPYLEILELFMKQASVLNKPIILHAVYEDAPIVCTMLEKYSVKKAHFHWFKGDEKTIEHMQQNGYFISITPDIIYEKEIQQLVENYPLTQMMIETDGPWEFAGPFKGKFTHPKMLHQIVKKIALIKNVDIKSVYKTLYQNTIEFYHLNEFHK